MSFALRHHNRLKFPTKHVVVAEDDLDNQLLFAQWAKGRFEPQGDVQFDFVCSGIGLASLFTNFLPNLVILDHDLPYGNASDFLTWLHETGKKVPIITASGMPENNTHMIKLCEEFEFECHHFQKIEVMLGKADDIIMEVLTRGGPIQ